jgi:hypothetical protein
VSTLVSVEGTMRRGRGSAEGVGARSGKGLHSTKDGNPRVGVRTGARHEAPTSVDAYTIASLKEWFEDKDIATVLLLSINKNRLFTDHKKLGFRDEETLKKSPQVHRPEVSLESEQNGSAAPA